MSPATGISGPGAERLDAVLRDALTSTYVDDGYYALLRADVDEWKARGTPLTEAERTEYEALVLHEAWLLDRRAGRAAVEDDESSAPEPELVTFDQD